MTAVGLALSALFPAVRSAPGLSRTPRRVEASSVLASLPVDPDEADPDSSESPSFPENDREGDLGGPESPIEELAADDWLAARLVRTRATEQSRADRQPPAAGLFADSPSGRPIRRPDPPTGPPHVGLPVRLCRLLF